MAKSEKEQINEIILQEIENVSRNKWMPVSERNEKIKQLRESIVK
jgi:hypothetical protein